MDEIIQLQEEFKDEKFRNSNHEDTFKKILSKMENTSSENLKEKKWQNLAEIFRTLRNSCINCPQNQILLMNLEIPKFVVGRIMQPDLTFEPGCTRMKLCGLQFLGNFVAGNEETQKYLWNIGFPQLFEYFLKENIKDSKLFNTCSMILFNCMNVGFALKDLMTSSTGRDIVAIMCNQLERSPDQDWIMLCITEHFLKHEQFLPIVFSQCTTTIHCDVLQVLCDFIQQNEDMDRNTDWFNSCFHFICQQFIDESISTSPLQDSRILHLLLTTLCWMTSIPGSWRNIVEKEDLIPAVLTVLRKICEDDKKRTQKGKKKLDRNDDRAPIDLSTNNSINKLEIIEETRNLDLKNDFETTSVEDYDRKGEGVGQKGEKIGGCNNKLPFQGLMGGGELKSDTKLTGEKLGVRNPKVDPQGVETPNLCFRRDLIRLIGNISFQNHHFQDKIREFGGLSLVLDSCNIDDLNPFMQQWAVFAIRNLCENNPDNQEEIAKLEKLGVADSPVLKSMGLTAEQDENGKIKITQKK